MTREVELLIDMWDTLHRECHKVVTEENYDVIKKAIKALEQEPILDKVKQAREEIENLNLNDYGDNLYQFQAKCTEILDKLMESEGEI